MWRAYSLFAGVLVSSIACGGKFQPDQGGASGGTGPSGGSTSKGGTASGGESASGGSSSSGSGGFSAGADSSGGTTAAGTGSGAAGSSNAGSSNGGSSTGGRPSSSECTDSSDCVVYSDCCSCGPGAVDNPPPECALECFQDGCSAKGLSGVGAKCVAGRCVFDLSCDTSQVGCDMATPECEPGQTPSVMGSCYGPCIPVTQCSAVQDCSACDVSRGEACVNVEPEFASYHCVATTSECANAPSCECVDACGSFECNVNETQVNCVCPNC